MVFGLIFIAILLVPFVFYCLSLQKALNRCSPECRAMNPGMVWLMFIPLFNLVWHFFVVHQHGQVAGRVNSRSVASPKTPSRVKSSA